MIILKTVCYFLAVATVIAPFIGGTSFNAAAGSSSAEEMAMKIKMTFNDTVVTATLYDNATTRSLAAELPLTLPMLDRYSRELVYRFQQSLPTDEVSVRGYEVGEIVYYPPLHSFVILYAQNGERFSMQRLGFVDSGIELFENLGNTSVTIERAD